MGGFDMPMLAMLMDYNRTFAENAKEAGVVTLLGMVAVFLVLSVLWLVIELMHRGLSLPELIRSRRKKKKEPEPEAPEEKIAAGEEPVTDDGALIAAITAAITAARAEEGIDTGFRVVAFRRARR